MDGLVGKNLVESPTQYVKKDREEDEQFPSQHHDSK